VLSGGCWDASICAAQSRGRKLGNPGWFELTLGPSLGTEEGIADAPVFHSP